MHARHSSLFAGLSLVVAGSVAMAQAPAGSMPAAETSAPEVRAMAPDFDAPMVDSSGAPATEVSLKALRGHVVVLAFYPKDRSGGCTAELSKFRDEYQTLFGRGVVVLPVSVDSISSHAGWAKDMHFPFALVSDVDGHVATAYGSLPPGRPYTNRTVFVIGKDGRVAYRNMRFGALDQHAYDELHAAVLQANAG